MFHIFLCNYSGRESRAVTARNCPASDSLLGAQGGDSEPAIGVIDTTNMPDLVMSDDSDDDLPCLEGLGQVCP